ncbi:MAG: hypothetical protein SXU28_03410 [Pseudomonadota bacterium]|nr:hypothetical protein [Pseudomonadota bacterium]
MTGLYLIFAAGKRPTRAALKEFAAGHNSVCVSHDPYESTPLHLVEAGTEFSSTDNPENQSPQTQEDVWIELLRDGLTFDIAGLAPGGLSPFPEIEHRFDLSDIPTAFQFDAVHLRAGQHLKGGENTAPVVKGLIGLATELAHYFEDLAAVVWPPSKSAIGCRYFESVSTAWLDGGPFPALGLTAFKETIDGALQSIGLDFWIGQELRIEPPLSSDKVQATRLAARIVNQLIIVGGLEVSERIVAPDGMQLVMRPSRNQKFVRVWRE